MSKKKTLCVFIVLFVLFAVMLGCFVTAIAFAEEIQQFKIEVYKKLPWREEYARAQETATDFSAFPMIMQDENAWYNDGKLIMHACGGIDGLDYTNSREAMEETLKKGHRYVEVDFSFTSDGVPVCVHSWSDLKSDDVMDYESFMAHDVFGKYSPMDAADIIEYMECFPDLYIILDTKDSMTQLVTALAEMDVSREIMERFIVQVYAAGEKAEIMKIYPFPEDNFLFTAYILGNRPGYIMSLCYEENISIVTLPYGWFSDDWHQFVEKDYVLFTHTVNRPDEMKALLERGIHGIYTDFLSEEDLSR